IGDAVLGMLTFVPAVWVLVGVAVVLVGVFPRATVAAWAALGVCFVIGMFGQVLDLPTWVQDVSPFQHVPRYPPADLDLGPLLVLFALAAALTALGIAGLRRRDLA